MGHNPAPFVEIREDRVNIWADGGLGGNSAGGSPIAFSLLEFGTAWREPGPMIVHCWAGISRSTAAALILACALDPARDEQAAADALRAASPTATPNALMIALADDLLGRQGRLIRAAASIGPGELAMWGEPFRIRARG